MVIPMETRDRLDRLERATGSSTLVQTIGYAISMLEWIVDQREKGRDVMVRGDGDPEVVHFFFPTMP